MSDSISVGSVEIPIRLIRIPDVAGGAAQRVLAAVILGAALMMPIAVMLQTAAPIPSFVLFVACFIVLTMFSTTLIHELGHLAAAWCMEWEILAFGAGPFVIRRSGGKLRIHWSNRPQAFVSANPRDVSSIRWQSAVFAAAGPTAGLLIAVIILVLVWRFAPIPIWGPFGVVFASFLILSGLFNLVPNSRFGFQNDGAVVTSMIAGGTGEQRSSALTQLGIWEQSGPRPREWDDRVVSAAVAVSDGTYHEAVGRLLAYYYEVDHGDLDSAEASLSRSISIISSLPKFSSMTGSLSTHALAEAAFIVARRGRDLDECAMVLDRLRELGPDPRIFRLEAAIRLAQGNLSLARESAREALVLLDQMPASVEQRERHWVNDLLIEANTTSNVE